jgi:hypothetical protein
MAPEVKTAKNSKLPKLSENCFEPVGKGGWPPISTWIITSYYVYFDALNGETLMHDTSQILGTVFLELTHFVYSMSCL